MISRIPTAGATVPPAQQRGSAAVARPWCRSGATYIREPYAQIQKHSQLNKNAHFAQMTRIAPTGGGAPGSHPARDPV